MKIYIFIIIIILNCIIPVKGQVQAITSKRIAINFDKTIHLIFPVNIDYFNPGSEDVLAGIAEHVPYVLKIKANEENFTEETNISVITTDGKFYSFSVFYSKNVEKTIFFADRDSVVEAIPIPVCSSKSVHVIFPSDVIYKDCGNEQLIELSKTKASNVIRFTARVQDIPETNLTVISSDKKLYCFTLNYNSNPETFNYMVGSKPIAIINNNEKLLSDISQQALKRNRNIYHLGISKNKMEFYCSNIFIKNNTLYFCFGINNLSNINFNADFLKCYIKDNKQLRNTTIQETEVTPVGIYNFQNIVKNNTGFSFVLAFNKFTIPDKKKFEIEIFDEDGGRHLKFKIDNQDIITAQKL